MTTRIFFFIDSLLNRVGVGITRAVSTMWCALAFACLALVSLGAIVWDNLLLSGIFLGVGLLGGAVTLYRAGRGRLAPADALLQAGPAGP